MLSSECRTVLVSPVSCVSSVSSLYLLCLLDCFIPFTCLQLPSHVVHLFLPLLFRSFPCLLLDCCLLFVVPSFVLLVRIPDPVFFDPALTPNSMPFPFWTFCLLKKRFASLKSAFCYPHRVLSILSAHELLHLATRDTGGACN